MIGLAGTKADPVMVHFAAHCVLAGVTFAVVDLMDAASRGGWQLSAPPQSGDFVASSEHVRLGDLTSMYLRPIYVGSTAQQAARWQGLMDGLACWMDESDLLVVNRLGANQLNSSKPAHYAWLAAHGFRVPPSLLSSDTDRVAAFVGAGPTVVKPVSGVRSRTRELTTEDLGRLAARDGPVLVQRRITGDDVRAHVVGREVIACRFASTAIDYRTDREARRSVVDLPAELVEQLIAATAAQRLTFAGWDFKVDDDGSYWCLECNPMPGYSFYDRVCGGAVSRALIQVLLGASPARSPTERWDASGVSATP